MTKKNPALALDAHPTWDNTAQVVGIIDGDTIDVVVRHHYWPCGWGSTQYRIRINHLDANETRHGKAADEAEIQRGQGDKEYLATIIGNKRVRVVATNRDNYGRILADVYIPNPRWKCWGADKLVSDLMKAAGHCKADSRWNT